MVTLYSRRDRFTLSNTIQHIFVMLESQHDSHDHESQHDSQHESLSLTQVQELIKYRTYTLKFSLRI